MDYCIRAIVARIADGRAVQMFMFIMPFSVRIRTNTKSCRINARIEYIIEPGQMVLILRYSDTTQYRYQTNKVSSIAWIVQ